MCFFVSIVIKIKRDTTYKHIHIYTGRTNLWVQNHRCSKTQWIFNGYLLILLGFDKRSLEPLGQSKCKVSVAAVECVRNRFRGWLFLFLNSHFALFTIRCWRWDKLKDLGEANIDVMGRNGLEIFDSLTLNSLLHTILYLCYAFIRYRYVIK